MKMEQTECSETSAYKIQTPGNYLEESIQHSEHGESFKSRIRIVNMYNNVRRFGDGLWILLRFRQRDFTLLGRLIKDIFHQDTIKFFYTCTEKFAENGVHVFKISIFTIDNIYIE